MNGLRLYPLDERGAAYIREHLGDLTTYCSALRSRVMTQAGNPFTLAPTGTPMERLHRFYEGGLLQSNLDEGRLIKAEGGWLMPVDDLKTEQAKLIVRLLSEHAASSCMVDDFNPEWGDPRRQYDLGETAFGVGQEVYHWFDTRHDQTAISATLRDADTVWHGVSSVALCPAPETSPGRDWLLKHANTAVTIFCSAYDGEGFVGWSCVPQATEHQ